MSDQVEELPIEHTAICYTDGSALNNSRDKPYGAGSHGYIFSNQPPAKRHTDQPNGNTITNIGYLEKEQLPKIEHVLVAPIVYINAVYSYIPPGTNNIGELLGVAETLNQLLKLEDYNLTKVIFKTDSTYVLGVVHTIMTDNNKEWKLDTTKPNYNYWLLLEGLLAEAQEANLEVTAIKVKAHGTDLGNNLADRLAFLGRDKSCHHKPELLFTLTDSKKYWKPNLVRHPLLKVKQLFFTGEHRAINREHTMYSIINYSAVDEVGKKSNTAGFGLVIFKDQPPVEIETYIDNYTSKLHNMSVISTIILDQLYSQPTMLNTTLFGNDVITFNYKTKQLSVLEGEPVVMAIRPPGLANAAIKKTYVLYNLVKDYLINKKDTISRTYTDITNLVYEVNDKGKNLCILPASAKLLTTKIPEATITLELGLDIINRNSLKSIEKLEPKLTLVVNKISDKFLEYYTIVELNTGDIGVYCNMYTNSVYLK